MNGILNAITLVQRWQNAGGFPRFDAEFSSIVGGYPKNSILQKSDGTGLWVSTAENNSSNPDMGGSNWSDLISGAKFGNDTGTGSVYAVTYAPAITVLSDGMQLRFRAKASANTGAVTFSPNGLSVLPVYGIDGNPLSGGEIAAGAICTVVYSSTTSRWTLVSSTLGELQVPAATEASHAVNLGQFSFVAAVNGYVKIPTSSSPIIIQWGQSASANLATSSAVFPIAFPTACLNVIAGGANANANTQAYAVVNNTSKIGFSWNAFIAIGGSAPALATSGTVNAWYIAVGV